MPPHWKNWASVSISLVTRATKRAPTLLIVVGEAQPVDVTDQSSAQVVQRLLAACAEAHDGVALGDPGHNEGSGGDQPELGDEADAHLLGTHDPFVDGLLEEDRNDHASHGADDRQHPRDTKALAQDRGLLQPATDRPHRREPRWWRRESAARFDHQVSHRRPPSPSPRCGRLRTPRPTAGTTRFVTSIRHASRGRPPCHVRRR